MSSIREPDQVWLERAWRRLDSLTKPPKSLGRLEEMAAKMALAQQTDRPVATPAAIVLCAGDHGIVAEGVSAWPQEVTGQMVANFVSGGAAINQIARYTGVRLVLVDVGVVSDTSALGGVVQAKVRAGTRNFAEEAAMTREEAAEAFLVGARMVRMLANEGVKVVGTGEMGIGNTTSASALVAAYTNVPVNRVVGRGTGIDDAALARKTKVVENALQFHLAERGDLLATLAALGGLEIAAMAGIFVGAAAAGVCAVADGFISSAAALAAAALCPPCRHFMFPSHLSAEPGHHVAMVALGLEPYMELNMRLGEGTGAALGIGAMGAACAVMSGMATFEQAGVSEGENPVT
ncbi:MAG: nicotinate-nucleotide--dimethylbenzimidazole phosphoribosyltransferase [Actinobacteria bacterium]|nr:nicotinate-nucleotide--dimethylbenzimidazole phosphoribosyltransferase [Actinomycetota bacterium]